MGYVLRTATATDYDRIIRVVDEWWGGRPMADMLPRLFFIHFRDTCFVAGAAGEPVAFLAGLISQAGPGQAYIHFVGVHPEYRDQGLAKSMYEHFFTLARSRGCLTVHCVTSPVNKGSIAFHRKMGFGINQGNREEEGVSFFADYDGPGQDRVVFTREL